MVFILFIITTGIAYYAYHNMKLRVLSLTFWSSLMFAAFSFFYALTVFDMKSDISIETIVVITSFLLVTALGEIIGQHRNLVFRWGSGNHPYYPTWPVSRIVIKKWKIFLLFAIYMVVAIDRYRNLSALVIKEYGTAYSAIEMISKARLLFIESNKELELSNTVFNQLIYMCELSAFMALYFFLNNWLNCNKRDYHYLLLLVPDLILRFLSTSRTSFIILFMGIIVIYFCVVMKKRRLRKLRVPKWLYISIGVFAVAFLVYGRVRNEVTTIPLVGYLQMYTCSSIYNLDFLLGNGWTANPYFGFHTFEHIYSLLGIEHAAAKTWNVMREFSRTSSIHSNVYTSLMGPISDYGVIGMLLARFFCSVIGAFIVNKLMKTSSRSGMFYVFLYFAIMVVYCYMYSATGDVYYGLYLNPSMTIRYILYAWILIHFLGLSSGYRG